METPSRPIPKKRIFVLNRSRPFFLIPELEPECLTYLNKLKKYGLYLLHIQSPNMDGKDMWKIQADKPWGAFPDPTGRAETFEPERFLADYVPLNEVVVLEAISTDAEQKFDVHVRLFKRERVTNNEFRDTAIAGSHVRINQIDAKEGEMPRLVNMDETVKLAVLDMGGSHHNYACSSIVLAAQSAIINRWYARAFPEGSTQYQR